MVQRPQIKEDGPIKKALDSGRCPRCLCQMQPVDVHGHQQCAVCKFYVVECCDGETCLSASAVQEA